MCFLAEQRWRVKYASLCKWTSSTSFQGSLFVDVCIKGYEWLLYLATKSWSWQKKWKIVKLKEENIWSLVSSIRCTILHQKAKNNRKNTWDLWLYVAVSCDLLALPGAFPTGPDFRLLLKRIPRAFERFSLAVRVSLVCTVPSNLSTSQTFHHSEGDSSSAFAVKCCLMTNIKVHYHDLPMH